MCQSEEDEALWHDDPQEYIRIKYGNHLFQAYIGRQNLLWFSVKETKKKILFSFVTEPL